MSRQISIDVPERNNIHNIVASIKAIREISGLGLKESKDIVDVVGQHVIPVSIHISDPDLENAFRILRGNGIAVGKPVWRILQDLRELGAQALKLGEDELANEILQLVLAEKLRRGTDVLENA